MKLQRLEISGFKSFVEPVTTEFAGGITAIVGPNGCGKSNLAEAVTWVLGEQSAKSLRGATMEDVIFNGSDNRRPLGMAEVSLTLLADPSQAETTDGRITIGRRVFRSGESEYRLNDKLVRLKDIKDLLMDTGLGIKAYSVIEQGRIGQILSGRPQERRKLIEEAAGVTRYKARKRVAELKLEDATGNLLRLDDIISEVERALRSLKRQANAARRYKEREAEYRELLEVVLIGRCSQLAGELRELGRTLAGRTDRAAEITALLHRREAELTAARERLEALGEELSSRHQRQAELAATIEGRQEFIKGAGQTLQELAERLEQGRTLAKRGAAELEAHGEAIAALDERRLRLLAERDEAFAAVEEDRQQLRAAEEALANAEARLEALRSQLMSSIAQTNAIQNRLHQEQIEREKANYRRDHLTAELGQRRQELDAARRALDEATTRVDELSTRLTHQTGELERLQRELDELLRREAAASERRQQLQEERVSARHRQSALEELAEAEAKKRTALREELIALGVEEPRLLADSLSVPEGWEASLDLYLEQLRDAVVVPADRDPLELARTLSQSRSQGTLIRSSAPASLKRSEASEVGPEGAADDDSAHGSASGTEAEPASPPAAIDDPAIERPLGEALGLEPELAATLPPAYLVGSAADAERLARAHWGVAFISRDRLWAQGGVLHLQGEQARPGTLSRTRELQDLGERIAELESELEATDEELAELVKRRTHLAADRNRAESAVAESRQELAVAQARHQDAKDRHTQIAGEHQTLAGEGEELSGRLDRMAQREGELHAELEAAQGHHRQLEERFDAAEAEVAEARERRETLRTAGAGRQGRLELLDERVDAQTTETRRLYRQREEARLHVVRWAEEEKSLEQRRTDLERRREEAEVELQQALEERVEADAAARGGQERLEEERQSVRTLDQEVQGLRERREQEQGEIQELRVRQAELRQESGHLAADFREHFARELPEELPEPPADLDERSAELDERKSVLDRMGPVNVLAAEEYTEQEERHQFLTEQRTDVADSVEQLRRTIRDINQTSAERFRATFTEVNENFGRIFANLFRGGEAEMRLLDEDDPIDSGIEIVARPPGKRLQNIMLLSGGEKALSAIALLFALFETKPSPFCILDEVDAPLDDANILRFVQVLKEMARDTQFLIITHNKLTMEVASTLYGVTMEERGVSKLVAVDVDDLHPESELASA